MSSLQPPLVAALALTAVALAACQEGEKDGAAPVAAATPAQTARSHTETRKFRDWLAVCDNGNACFALGSAPEGQSGWVRVSLAPGPGARPEIAAGFPGDGAAPGALALEVDGRRFVTDTASAPTDAKGSFGVIRRQPLPAVKALTSGRRLTLTDGGERVPVSLSGASAALSWIDDRQGRLGTTAALVRRGRRPAAAAAAPALPSVTPAPAIAQTGLPRPVLPAAFEARADVKQCRSDTAFSAAFQSGVTIDRLSEDRELWGLPCFAGSYNFSFRYFITGRGGVDPAPVIFPTSRKPTAEVVNSRYDPASRTLTAFDKGRGLGDCGVASTWVWAGRAFVLKAEREMRECWGVPADLWPTTWRSR